MKGDHTPSPMTRNSNTFPRGAPKGNRNALKHGRYTKEMLALRAEARMNLQKIKASLALLAARSALVMPPVRSLRVVPKDSAPPSGAARASASRGR